VKSLPRHRGDRPKLNPDFGLTPRQVASSLGTADRVAGPLVAAGAHRRPDRRGQPDKPMRAGGHQALSKSLSLDILPQREKTILIEAILPAKPIETFSQPRAICSEVSFLCLKTVFSASELAKSHTGLTPRLWL
jgi:hypothetical protein